MGKGFPKCFVMKLFRGGAVLMKMSPAVVLGLILYGILPSCIVVHLSLKNLQPAVFVPALFCLLPNSI